MLSSKLFFKENLKFLKELRDTILSWKGKVKGGGQEACKKEEIKKEPKEAKVQSLE